MLYDPYLNTEDLVKHSLQQPWTRSHQGVQLFTLQLKHAWTLQCKPSKTKTS